MNVATLTALSMILFYFYGVIAKNPSASLTAFNSLEEGVSLVGPHCPGTVRLFCEGVDLAILRWSYNFSNSIQEYDPNDLPVMTTPLTDNGLDIGVVSIILHAVQPVPSDERFANFNSSLIMNLTKLQDQKIANISCGDLGTMATKLVDVHIIIEQTRPKTPNITEVSANYRFRKLSSITVSWKTLEVQCPNFVESLGYELNLTAHDSFYTKQMNCKETLCTVTILNISAVEKYHISLRSWNSIGASNASIYPIAIDQHNQTFFSPKASWNDNNQAEVQCAVAKNLEDTTCTILYATDLYNLQLGLAGKITVEADTPVVLPDLISNSTFYFKFSVFASDTFLIVEIIQLTRTRTRNEGSQQQSTIFIVIVAVALLILIPFSFGVTFLLVWTRRKKHNNNGRYSTHDANLSSSRSA